jgi:catechol-2,3-dioxygenase
MIQVSRLGHATFTTPDIEKLADYWSVIIGLQIVERSAEARLTRMSLQVKPDSDMRAFAAELAAEGVDSETQSGVTPGVAAALVFKDPNGTAIELYDGYTFHPRDKSDTGVSPLKFGHVAHRVLDVHKVVSFYTKFLGFRESDWMGDHFAFLRCGVDHHTVNFVRYDEPRLHHIAFEVKDWGELHRDVEVLAKHGVELVWGPIRHVVGHNVAAYHRNPDDVRVELFCEMDQMKDEALGYWEPRPWHEEMPLYPKRWPKETRRSAWGFGSYGTFPGYP